MSVGILWITKGNEVPQKDGQVCTFFNVNVIAYWEEKACRIQAEGVVLDHADVESRRLTLDIRAKALSNLERRCCTTNGDVQSRQAAPKPVQHRGA